MADVFHAIPVLAIVEAPVFDLPTALGHAVETQAAQLGNGEVGQPFGLDYRPIGFVLAVTQHADLRPVEGFPSVEVSVIPDLDPIASLLKYCLGWLTVKTSSHGSGQGWKVFLKARHHR